MEFYRPVVREESAAYAPPLFGPERALHGARHQRAPSLAREHLGVAPERQVLAVRFEREHLARAIELHRRVTGTRPLGWYLGRCSPNTRRLIAATEGRVSGDVLTGQGHSSESLAVGQRDGREGIANIGDRGR